MYKTQPSAFPPFSRRFPPLQLPGTAVAQHGGHGGRSHGRAVQHRQVVEGLVAVLAEAQFPGPGADGVDDALLGAWLPQVAPTDVAQPGMMALKGKRGWRNCVFLGGKWRLDGFLGARVNISVEFC